MIECRSKYNFCVLVFLVKVFTFLRDTILISIQCKQVIIFIITFGNPIPCDCNGNPSRFRFDFTFRDLCKICPVFLCQLIGCRSFLKVFKHRIPGSNNMVNHIISQFRSLRLLFRLLLYYGLLRFRNRLRFLFPQRKKYGKSHSHEQNNTRDKEHNIEKLGFAFLPFSSGFKFHGPSLFRLV